MKSNNLWNADLGNGSYRNPILYADYSDPDAIRVGEDYFMIAASFCNAPGLPLLHSKDLVNWKVVNYIINEIPEERYREPIHGCGVWAPAIRCRAVMTLPFLFCIPRTVRRMRLAVVSFGDTREARPAERAIPK